MTLQTLSLHAMCALKLVTVTSQTSTSACESLREAILGLCASNATLGWLTGLLKEAVVVKGALVPH